MASIATCLLEARALLTCPAIARCLSRGTGAFHAALRNAGPLADDSDQRMAFAHRKAGDPMLTRPLDHIADLHVGPERVGSASRRPVSFAFSPRPPAARRPVFV